MKEMISYCGRDKDDRYVHFFKNELGVSFSGHDEIFKVRIKECNQEEINTHWSWWDNNSNQFNFTHYNKMGVTICFPYGISIMEREGEGKLLPVIVELL